MNESKLILENKIKEFLKEDIGLGDITSGTLIPRLQRAKARLYYREEGVVSGLTEASMIFEYLGCQVQTHAEEGDWTKPGETLLTVEGYASDILVGERTALNIVGRMAGIATQTANIIKKTHVIDPEVRIAATRKTIPGLRFIDKRAVQHGGGDPHRFRLDDCVLIKDNHLNLLPSITEAVKQARKAVSFTKKIEVEVKTLDEALEAIRAGADIVMFDNMTPTQIKESLKSIKDAGLRERVLFEASGGINAANAESYAETGVDVISMGSLTHSIRSLDVKLEVSMIDA